MGSVAYRIERMPNPPAFPPELLDDLGHIQATLPQQNQIPPYRLFADCRLGSEFLDLGEFPWIGREDFQQLPLAGNRGVNGRSVLPRRAAANTGGKGVGGLGMDVSAINPTPAGMSVPFSQQVDFDVQKVGLCPINIRLVVMPVLNLP